MRPILCNSGENVELNALFIQPTRWCARNCKGCYVKEHAANTKHIPYMELIRFFSMFYHGPHWANQITISMDDLPEDQAKQRWLQQIYTHLSRILRADHRFEDERPEVHVTFHTFETYKSYIDIHDMEMFDMISFSQLTRQNFGTIKTLKSVGFQPSVNYNYLIPDNVTSFNIDKYIYHLIEAAQVVDSVYLIVFKTPVGKPQNNLVKLTNRSRMMNDTLFINTVLQRVPQELRSKFHVDGCLQDVQRFKKTGFGCSSNISRVQVWPDGSVTGCAYAHKSNGPTAYSAEEIVENIKLARKEYDFRTRCHLPTTYDSIQR